MTDILIRGMDMPKGNNTISITIFSNGKVSLAHDKKYAEYAEAVPLPEGHGRLIDGNALYQAMFTASDGTIMPNRDIDGWHFEMKYEDIKRCIRKAPTIVPAEEGETDDSKL